MTTTRQNKVSRLLHRELGDYFQKHGSEITGGKMVTVTVVRISPDLSVARVYVSIFPFNPKEDLLKSITEHTGAIRNEMGKRLKHQLRHIPEFVFYLDDSLDYIERIDDLLNE
ncbi:MAG: 30S ribosome-binding factor RbfA [Bacteroidales bacterium]